MKYERSITSGLEVMAKIKVSTTPLTRPPTPTRTVGL